MTSLRFDEQTKIYVSQDSGTLFTIDFPIQNYQPLREFWTHLAHLGPGWVKPRCPGMAKVFFPMEREMKMGQPLALFADSKRFRVSNIRDVLGFVFVFEYNRNRCSWSYRFPNIRCASEIEPQQLQSGSVPYTQKNSTNAQKPSKAKLQAVSAMRLSTFHIYICIIIYTWL